MDEAPGRPCSDGRALRLALLGGNLRRPQAGHAPSLPNVGIDCCFSRTHKHRPGELPASRSIRASRRAGISYTVLFFFPPAISSVGISRNLAVPVCSLIEHSAPVIPGSMPIMMSCSIISAYLKVRTFVAARSCTEFGADAAARRYDHDLSPHRSKGFAVVLSFVLQERTDALLHRHRTMHPSGAMQRPDVTLKVPLFLYDQQHFL